MVAGLDMRLIARPVSAGPLPHLLRPVVSLLVSAAHEISSATPAASHRAAPQAAFALEALTATPLVSALILIASVAAVNLRYRRHQRILLRC